MHVAVTGASGLIGTALVEALGARGDTVRPLRRPTDWDPDAGTFDVDALRGADAVVHLAGENIGEHRWTPEHKQRILDSRTRGTGLLARTIASMDAGVRPSVLVSASAIGWYGGKRGSEPLTEASPPPAARDFVAQVCRAWEAGTQPAEDAGVRVVHLRTGIVLTPTGGVLKRMLLPFRLGLGGKQASGEQYMSWISLDDVVGAYLHALDHTEVRGPVNATAPNPVTNAEFAKTLGRVLRRPTVLPTPLLPLRLRYGSELVEVLLVEGQRVLPERLQETGYRFRHTTLEAALRDLLAR